MNSNDQRKFMICPFQSVILELDIFEIQRKVGSKVRAIFFFLMIKKQSDKTGDTGTEGER